MIIVRYFYQILFPISEEIQYLYLKEYEKSVTVIKQKGECCVYVSSEYVEECSFINEYSLLHNHSKELDYCTILFMPDSLLQIKC